MVYTKLEHRVYRKRDTMEEAIKNEELWPGVVWFLTIVFGGGTLVAFLTGVFHYMSVETAETFIPIPAVLGTLLIVLTIATGMHYVFRAIIGYFFADEYIDAKHLNGVLRLVEQEKKKKAKKKTKKRKKRGR